MLKPYTFLQNARKIVNLKNRINPGTPGGLFQKLRGHPAARVMVVGLAIAGAVSLGQYIRESNHTQVQVTVREEEETPPVILAGEPVVVPEGSPSAPEDTPVEIYPAPVMNTVSEEKPAGATPDWTESQAPVRGPVTKSFTFGYAAFFDDYRLHSGQDYTAPLGTPVTAVLGGTVEAIFDHQLFGSMVVLDHGDGWQSYYAPVEEVEVIPGQWVSTGFQLGRLGPPPPAERDSGTHLHFELHHQGEPVDPGLYIK